MSRERSRSPTAEKTVPATDDHSLPQPRQVQEKETSEKRSPTGPSVSDMQVSRQALNKREKQLDQRELELEERKVTLEERELELEDRKVLAAMHGFVLAALPVWVIFGSLKPASENS